MTVGVTRDVLEDKFTDIVAEQIFVESGTLDSTARDSGNSTTTMLRVGLVLGKNSSTGNYHPWGENFTAVSSESVGTGDGSTKTFTLSHTVAVKYSESITVGGAAKTRGTDYEINYKAGRVTFYSAPASGDAIVASYDYDGTEDGTEDVAGILLERTNILDDEGNAAEMSAYVLKRGVLNNFNDLITKSTTNNTLLTEWLTELGISAIDNFSPSVDESGIV